MNNDMSLEQRARELLAAAIGCPVKSDTELDLSDKDRVWTKDALTAIKAALTPKETPRNDMSDELERLKQFRDFLCGVSDLDGGWFGEPKPGATGANAKARFWWRREFRQVVDKILATLSTPSPQGVETVEDGAVEQYVETYDYRCDEGGGYTPTEAEREMLTDAIYGFLADQRGGR